jgi:hypothetical protein
MAERKDKVELDTRVFIRIVEETKEKVLDTAKAVLADTMEETVRFGNFSREYIEDCANRRLGDAMYGKRWKARK